MYVYMYTSAYYYICVPCRCLCMSKEGVRCLGAAVTSGCGLPDVSAGSHTWVLCEHIRALTTEPCLYLLMMEQVIARKMRCRPELPFLGKGLWAWKDFCSSTRPSKYWGFVFVNQGTRTHLAQHRIGLVYGFTCFGPWHSLSGPSGVWVG